jgi:hypothetical protein
VNVPSWDGQARAVSFVWRLTKGARHAECRLWTHPVGAELRVDVGGELLRSEAGREPLALLDTAATWKAQFQKKGWQ